MVFQLNIFKIQRKLILFMFKKKFLFNVAPLGGPRTCTDVVRLGDYLLPKDTIVMFNLSSVHRDEKYWDFPEQFRPERWLDQLGNLIKHEAFIPFSMGRYLSLRV